MKKSLGVIALAAAATLFSTGEALAVPITGGIGIGGEVTVASATDLTLVDFVGDGWVLVSSLPGVSGGATVTLTDIDFMSPGEVWSVGGYTFTATSYGVPTDIMDVGGKEFTATGVLSAAGFDPTPGTYTFSSDSSGMLAVFSSTTTPSDVPEPTTLALFGVGLLGAGIAGRRRKNKT